METLATQVLAGTRGGGTLALVPMQVVIETEGLTRRGISNASFLENLFGDTGGEGKLAFALATAFGATFELLFPRLELSLELTALFISIALLLWKRHQGHGDVVAFKC